MVSIEEKEELISICQDLIRINSTNPPGNENEVVNYCERILKGIGAITQVIQHTPKRSSLIAKWPGKEGGKQILIISHADTVPIGTEAGWKTDPFSAEISDGKIYGRGASDMKGGIAVAISALKQLRRWGDLECTIIFALTADEESGGIGIQKLIEPCFDINPDFVIIPEPTENHIAIAEKGTLWLELVITGKSCHASSPSLGTNAIDGMVELLNKLNFSQFIKNTHPLLGRFSSCVTNVQGGIKINIVPDTCIAALDIRFLPGQSVDEIIGSIQNQITEIFHENTAISGEVKILLQREAIETKESNPFLKMIVASIKKVKNDVKIIGVSYFTDAAVIVPHFDVPFIICGPGKIDLMHTDNEFVAIEKLVESREIFIGLLKSLSNPYSKP